VKINMAAKIQNGDQNGCQSFLTLEKKYFSGFLYFKWC